MQESQLGSVFDSFKKDEGKKLRLELILEMSTLIGEVNWLWIFLVCFCFGFEEIGD